MTSASTLTKLFALSQAVSRENPKSVIEQTLREAMEAVNAAARCLPDDKNDLENAKEVWMENWTRNMVRYTPIARVPHW